ncbi:copper resistance protein CopC [Bradyrhizobium diazoefficiens]|uniref:copper resistance CopC family protein n=1 Tax=Bradyrhizobium manausense TaxID=989370 RepID=UPI001B8A5E6B|nr:MULTISPECIES: copper resistance CopC family protein [Bradyrhizobium]MBR0964061.1 copper resistance protein CopC [Bradyrhizobium diazoefficiens]MBR0978221.1 copper resistance protein CopC [Bradyrhizobium diazoefficiens]MBR1006152.1 copper resistance protein CopC [Bradyrhizobium diazoefficiens]MBR1014204.1 copper resistance protein CopC [Bradyrhizobium diazoefficiens]MBR1050341.1 copper resistance protein CopC [Bradyrhizobium diazoefficiens]
MSLRTLLTVAAFAVWPNWAFAHAALVGSSPGSRAVVTHMPDHIDLCFNEPVEVKFSTVQITDEKGTTIPISELKHGADPKCLSATVPPAAAGIYTVKYRVLSQDGHVVKYGFQFTVRERQPVP